MFYNTTSSVFARRIRIFVKLFMVKIAMKCNILLLQNMEWNSSNLNYTNQRGHLSFVSAAISKNITGLLRRFTPRKDFLIILLISSSFLSFAYFRKGESSESKQPNEAM